MLRIGGRTPSTTAQSLQHPQIAQNTAAAPLVYVLHTARFETCIYCRGVVCPGVFGGIFLHCKLFHLCSCRLKEAFKTPLAFWSYCFRWTLLSFLQEVVSLLVKRFVVSHRGLGL